MLILGIFLAVILMVAGNIILAIECKGSFKGFIGTILLMIGIILWAYIFFKFIN